MTKLNLLLLDIVKNQPLDLMSVLCEFLCDKAGAPLAGVIFSKTEA